MVYVLIPLAVAYFAIMPSKTLSEAATRGAFLGTSMYGLYDLTNLASLKGWTTAMAVTDTLWGTVLCGIWRLVVGSRTVRTSYIGGPHELRLTITT